MSRKIFCTLGALMLSLTLTPVSLYACQPPNTTSKTPSNMTFKFEDYEKQEDGKKRLLELFPIGSAINEFTNTMKSIKGVECIEVYKDGLACTYVVPISKDVAYGWYVSVSSEANKITDIDATKTFGVYYPPGTPPVGLPIRGK
jgi:hypothetical protein